LVEQQLRSPQAVEEMRRHSRGVTDFRLRLYWDEFKTLSITLPPATEQTAIAAFLDRETAKIDALIAEQDKLLALLTEKRQATISHAVTKGLDPNVSMKDSGVKWLGEVPRH
jgi:type I restriction enzyme S subunit